MKQYWLFAGNYYYPNWGMEDFRISYDSIDECLTDLVSKGFELNESSTDYWYQIYDSKNHQIVKSGCFYSSELNLENIWKKSS